MREQQTDEKHTIYIFHISRNGLRPAFYHPLAGNQTFITQAEENRIRGRYGKDPRVESITQLRNDLYRKAETAVKFGIFERRFVPRFLISAGVFLFIYFIASFAIRDPIPLVDELLLAGGGALISYLLLGRRLLVSRAAAEKRNELRAVIDEISFTESGFVKKIEELLAEYDSADLADLLRIYESGGSPLMLPEWKPEARALENYLAGIFREKGVRNFGKRLQKHANPKKLIAGARIDFPLFVLYTVLRRG
jgi:hypothetical protein